MPASLYSRSFPVSFTVLSLAALAACASVTGCGSTNRKIAVNAPSASPSPIDDPSALSNYLAHSDPSDSRAYTTESTQYMFGSGTFTTSGSYTEKGGGAFFDTGSRGKSTTVTLSTSQGAVTVTKQEALGDQGQVTGYNYFTRNGTTYTEYGSDQLDTDTGNLSSASRFSPAVSYDLTLTPGQSQQMATQVTNMSYNILTEALVSTSTATASFHITFVDVESVTVPAGTFNTAKVTEDYHYDEGSSAYSSTTTTYSAAGVGRVKFVIDSSGYTDSSPYSSSVTYSLTSANIGGTHYGS